MLASSWNQISTACASLLCGSFLHDGVEVFLKSATASSSCGDGAAVAHDLPQRLALVVVENPSKFGITLDDIFSVIGDGVAESAVVRKWRIVFPALGQAG
jgi:hypothetical protein